MRFKIVDRGANALLGRFKRSGNSEVRVGFLGSSSPSESADGVSLLTIAAIHELGLGVPRRSMIADFVDEQSSSIKALLRSRSAFIVKGKKTEEQVLDEAGAVLAGMVQKRISAGIQPPNAPSTIAQKGSSTPLIDTGRLRQAVTWEVKRGL